MPVTYFSIVAEPTVTISQASVIFKTGDDWTTGSSMGTNSTYVSLAIKAYPNATLTYEEALNISNIDSDVDSSVDKGTHSDFTAQQYGSDSIYDTLT